MNVAEGKTLITTLEDYFRKPSSQTQGVEISLGPPSMCAVYMKKHPHVTLRILVHEMTVESLMPLLLFTCGKKL